MYQKCQPLVVKLKSNIYTPWMDLQNSPVVVPFHQPSDLPHAARTHIVLDGKTALTIDDFILITPSQAILIYYTKIVPTV